MYKNPRLILVLLFVLSAFVPAVSRAQAVVEDGFEDSLVANVMFPTALAPLPDGRVLVSSQLGQVFILSGGAVLPTPALDLTGTVCTYRERGLAGLAVDPQFETNGYVYVSYVAKHSSDCDVEWIDPPLGRVSRFVLGADNTIDRASEKILLDNIPSPIGVHNLDDVEFGKDGYLYVSVGDGGCDYFGDSGCFDSNDAARDMGTLNGKILRITRDGDVPPDNPFLGVDNAVRCALTGITDPGNVCAEIFAFGLRNPWRIAFDPNAAATRFFINDVGQDAWEEINEGKAGADYGWNLREAQCRNGTTDCSTTAPEGLTNPLFFYDRSAGCGSITGGAFVPNGLWPASFDGLYLFSDYVCGSIFKLIPGEDGSFVKQPFVTGLGDSSATDLHFILEGDRLALYYLTYAGGGEVRRIAYTGNSNRRPVASVTATPTSGGVPLVVDFDASGSSDPDGEALTFEWNFGDGTPVVEGGAAIRHSYDWPGTYYAIVVAKDASGAVGAASVFVDAGNNAPVPEILSPAADLQFAVGDTIQLRGSATDVEDGALAESALSWRVILHHKTHTHGFIAPTTGNAITFTAPGPENLEAAATSYLEVVLTATDTNGLTTTVSQALRPKFTQLTFASNPAGAQLKLGNATVTTPLTVASWVNYAIDVEVPAQTAADGTPLAFQSWSDGGAASHIIHAPAAAATYTVTFGDGETTPPPPPGLVSTTASSIESAEFPATNATDGDPATRWSSAYTDPQWLMIDLGSSRSIDRVVLSWEAAYATAYAIQVSGDGTNWQTVHQTTSGDGGVDVISGLAAQGRYVRMLGTARSTPWGYSLWEFQVFEGSGGGNPGGSSSTPFSGSPVSLPGVIQAEDFDNGGSGVGYLDSTPGNSGGEYRSTDVDIETTSDAGGGRNVGWLAVGEWLKYTVNVTTAGTYTLEFRVASAGPGGTFHLEIDGVDKTGPLTIPNTGDWQSWTTVQKTGVSLTSGSQVWRVVIDGAGASGAIGNFNYMRAVAAGGTGGNPSGPSTPYGGTRRSLPGLLQVEDYDAGGSGVGYLDTTPGNDGGQYRSDDVDIEPTADAGGGFDIGWLSPGEWLNYNVDVTAAGSYTLEFRVAAAGAGGTFHLEINGADVTGPLTIPNTGDWQTWTTVSRSGVSLSAGPQVWRLVIDSANTVVGNFNYIRVVGAGGGTPGGSTPTPYGGTRAVLPGTLQAEHFDEGAALAAYNDATPGNEGGEFRPTDVDIESTADSGGGFNVGWASAGEFLRYSVNVTAAGVYDIEFRVASSGPGGGFHLEVDGVDKTGVLSVPNTGGWQTWATVKKSGVALAAGPQVWRLVLDSNGPSGGVGNFNWIRLATGGTTPAISIERGPYLQQVTSTSAVVVWTTRTAGSGAVRYGIGSAGTTTANAESRLVPASLTGLAYDYFQHEARVAGLASGTTYSYDVLMNGVDVTPSQDQWRTAPSIGTGTVRFIAFGDSGIGSAEQRQLASVMAADQFDFALHGGDVAYGSAETTGGGDYRQFDDWLFGVYGSWMRSRPFFPAIGNHDDEIRAAAPYRDLFVLPENGATAAYPDNAERFYSFDYGPVHFVALDTETAFADPGRRAAQIAWLESDLAASAQPWKVVYLHRPPYNSGTGHGSDLEVRQAFSPLFERYGVQLVISAHEHIYERTIPIQQFGAAGSPVTYLVSGGGGARLYATGGDWWTAQTTSAYHYVRAVASECGLRIEAVGLNGAVFDQVDLTRCGATPAATASAGVR